jgi:hypothetical protein
MSHAVRCSSFCKSSHFLHLSVLLCLKFICLNSICNVWWQDEATLELSSVCKGHVKINMEGILTCKRVCEMARQLDVGTSWFWQTCWMLVRSCEGHVETYFPLIKWFWKGNKSVIMLWSLDFLKGLLFICTQSPRKEIHFSKIIWPWKTNVLCT